MKINNNVYQEIIIDKYTNININKLNNLNDIIKKFDLLIFKQTKQLYLYNDKLYVKNKDEFIQNYKKYLHSKHINVDINNNSYDIYINNINEINKDLSECIEHNYILNTQKLCIVKYKNISDIEIVFEENNIYNDMIYKVYVKKYGEPITYNILKNYIISFLTSLM